MRRGQAIRKLMRGLRHPASDEIHERILGNLLTVLRQRQELRSVVVQPALWGILGKKRVTKLGLAAGILIALAFGVSRFSREPPPVATQGVQVSAAEMLTAWRLNAAYRRGGLPELQRHCETAAQRLGLRPDERTPIDRFLQD